MHATLSFSPRCFSRILDVCASHLCYASTPPPRRPLESQIRWLMTATCLPRFVLLHGHIPKYEHVGKSMRIEGMRAHATPKATQYPQFFLTTTRSLGYRGNDAGDILLLCLRSRALGTRLGLQRGDAPVVVYVHLEQLPLVCDAEVQIVLLGKCLDLRHEFGVLVARHGREQMVLQLVLHAAPEPLGKGVAAHLSTPS